MGNKEAVIKEIEEIPETFLEEVLDPRPLFVKLPGHRPGLPGKVILLYCAP